MKVPPDCTSAPYVHPDFGLVTPAPHRKRGVRDVFVNCEPCGYRLLRHMAASGGFQREKAAHMSWQMRMARDMTEFEPLWKEYGYAGRD